VIALDREIAAVLAEQAAEPPAVTVAAVRAAHDRATPGLCGPGVAVAAVDDRAVPAGGRGVPVRVYEPQAERPLAGPAEGVRPARLPVIVYLHGGGWMLGTLDSVDAVCRGLAQAAQALVVSVDYRLAPEHPFPAALEDALAVAGWLAGHAEEWGGDPRRLAVAGDSAGGNLAAVVARRLRDRVAFQLLVYPAVDARAGTPSYDAFAEGWGLTATGMREMWASYAAGAAPEDPDLSPAGADLAGCPPAWVLVAEADVLRDEGEAYARRLQAAGVPVALVRPAGTAHGFWRWQARSRLAREAVQEAGEAIRAALADPIPA
jgi:acetyl esterase